MRATRAQSVLKLRNFGTWRAQGTQLRPVACPRLTTSFRGVPKAHNFGMGDEQEAASARAALQKECKSEVITTEHWTRLRNEQVWEGLAALF